jgi:hypothetical protein
VAARDGAHADAFGDAPGGGQNRGRDQGVVVPADDQGGWLEHATPVPAEEELWDVPEDELRV